MRTYCLDKLKVIDAKELFAADHEQELIDRTKNGDQIAFHQLYENYYRRIYALCWRLLADKDSAEDVCQEVFVKLWQKIQSFRGESKFSTWLHSVATNIVLGHVRKQKNWLQRIFSIEDHSINEVKVELTDERETSDLDAKIQQLPERARLVFVLFAVEGYRHEEIAKMLNMAVGSSKSQYHRARTLLRESLSEH